MKILFLILAIVAFIVMAVVAFSGGSFDTIGHLFGILGIGLGLLAAFFLPIP